MLSPSFSCLHYVNLVKRWKIVSFSYISGWPKWGQDAWLFGQIQQGSFLCFEINILNKILNVTTSSKFWYDEGSDLICFSQAYSSFFLIQVLFTQLESLGLNSKPIVERFLESYKAMWALNGHNLSRIFTGSRALDGKAKVAERSDNRHILGSCRCELNECY